MTKRSLALLFALLPAYLWAQTAIVAGKFPYQSKVPYQISHISNQLTLMDEWGVTKDTSDKEGLFQQKIELKEAELLSFKRGEGFQIYVKPGDSLWVEMVSIRNLTFGGTLGPENTLLRAFDNGTYEVSRDLQTYFGEYSAAADSMHLLRQKMIQEYEASAGADPDFVKLCYAKDDARFIKDKVRIREQQLKSGASNELAEKVARQLKTLTFWDELRAIEYLEALHDLLEMEALGLMGYDFTNVERNKDGTEAYPLGFSNIYTQHWQERMRDYPQLMRHFEATDLMQTVYACNSMARLPLAQQALARLERDFEYPTLLKMLRKEVAKKQVIYTLRKLPALDLKEEDGKILNLEPSTTQTDVYVFWDARDTLQRRYYSSFQALMMVRPEPDKRYIWVQMGLAEEDWLKAINGKPTLMGLPQDKESRENWLKVMETVPANKKVKHVVLDNPAQMQALKPYLIDNQLPASVYLDSNGQISNIRYELDRLVSGSDPETVMVGNRIYYLYRRE